MRNNGNEINEERKPINASVANAVTRKTKKTKKKIY